MRRGAGQRRQPQEEPRAETSEPRAFSWFPGHMRRALRLLEADLKLADAVLMVLDARLPDTSRNPDMERMLRRKGAELVYVLNKEDLADPEATRAWLRRLQAEGCPAVAMSALRGKGAGPLSSMLAQVAARVAAARARRGLAPREPRLVVAGIPNVGKSALLNRLVGRKQAATGDRPGVTRGRQWVVSQGRWHVLDTPGVLYPRVEGMDRLVRLAATACIREEAIPLEQVAGFLLLQLKGLDRLKEWGLSGELPEDPQALLEETGRRKGFLLTAGRVDTERAARWVLGQFREGKAGRITLELP